MPAAPHSPVLGPLSQAHLPSSPQSLPRGPRSQTPGSSSEPPPGPGQSRAVSLSARPLGANSHGNFIAFQCLPPQLATPLLCPAHEPQGHLCHAPAQHITDGQHVSAEENKHALQAGCPWCKQAVVGQVSLQTRGRTGLTELRSERAETSLRGEGRDDKAPRWGEGIKCSAKTLMHDEPLLKSVSRNTDWPGQMRSPPGTQVP